MIETIENLKSLVNHFFHKTGEGFEQIRQCEHCQTEYVANNLVWLWATSWEVVLWLKCGKCWQENVVQLNITLDPEWVDAEEAITSATTVEDLLSES